MHVTEVDIEAFEVRSPGRNGRESDVPPYNVPSLKNRQETVNWFAKHVYGSLKDGKSTSRLEASSESKPLAGPWAVGSLTARSFTTIAELPRNQLAFQWWLIEPVDPVAVLVHINPWHTDDFAKLPLDLFARHRIAIATMPTASISPDDPQRFTQGLLSAMDLDRAAPDSPGAIAAWVWAARRVADALEQILPGRKLGVVGHSRAGKAALWAGAIEPRFELVVSNQSGAGGAKLSRRNFGEPLKHLRRIFSYWFCPAFTDLVDKEHQQPMDQHNLIAAIAPRQVLINSAVSDLWADPRGEWESLAYASAAWGQPIDPAATPQLGLSRFGPLNYHIRPGPHALGEADWQAVLDVAEAGLK